MELISEDYLKEQQELHANNNDYGIASVGHAETVSELINENTFTQILDYGSGKGRLVQNLQVNHEAHLQLYDPAIPQFSTPPKPAELVVCLDVLEHIEPNHIDSVLDHLKSLTIKLGYFVINTAPASRILSDGRNAHLIQEQANWWLPKIVERFELDHLLRDGNWLKVLALPKNQ